MKNKTTKKAYMQWGILILVFAFFLVPYIVSIFYAVPNADDFSFAISGVKLNTLFRESIEHAYDRYFNWSGMFFYYFLSYLLNPLNLVGFGGHSVGVIMILKFLAFIIISLICFTNIFRSLYETKLIRVALAGMTVMGILSFHYNEIWFWSIGSTYMWQVLFEFLTVTCMISFFRKKKKLQYSLMIFFGIIACNSLLNCIPTGLFYLYCSYLEYKEVERFKFNRCIPIFFYILSGVITVAAPGNYVRKAALGGVHLFDIIMAALNTAVTTLDELLLVCSNPAIVFVILVSFVLGVTLNSKARKKKRNPGSAFFLGIMILYGMMFPVAYGYGSTDVPNRIHFVFVAYFVSYYTVLHFWLGQWFSGKFDVLWISQNNNVKKIWAGVFAYGFSMIIVTGCFNEMPWMMQIDHFGGTRIEYNVYMSLLSAIKNSEEEEVKIDLNVLLKLEDGQQIVQAGIIEPLRINDNPKNWINGAVARYFGKKSVLVYGMEWVEGNG